MKRLILHIGTHKTATTSLQRFMHLNADAFERAGLHVPATPSSFGHAERDRNGYFLGAAARNITLADRRTPKFEAEIDADVAAIRAALAGHDTLLLSEETLWYDGTTKSETWPLLERYLRDLGFDEVRFLVYFRRQDRFLFSYWNQYVKNATRKTEDFATYLTSLHARQVADYAGGLARLEELFGAGCTTVRLFEPRAFEGGSVYHDFAAALGVDADGLELPPAKLNPSLTLNIAELKRLANMSASYRAGYNFLMQPAIDAALSVADDTPQASPLTAGQLAEIRARCDAGNATIARRHFGRDELFDWPDADALPPAWTRDNPDMLRDAVVFFTEALVQERKRVKKLEKRVKKLEADLAERKQPRFRR